MAYEIKRLLSENSNVGLTLARVCSERSELSDVSKLQQCQKDALNEIRHLAKQKHEEALPGLVQRLEKMKIPISDLWPTLTWIRDIAPIIIHVNLDKTLSFMETDRYYRNQFETITSGGLLKQDMRRKWEHDLFMGVYDEAPAILRPKYGVLNVMNDYRGVVPCHQYGDSYLVLKDVRLRCTLSPEDSANLKADQLAVLDYYAHVLATFTDRELKEVVSVSREAENAIGNSEHSDKLKYKEAQIHGTIHFRRHVERLVAHTRHRGDEARLKKVCKLHGWQFSWMDQERGRLETELKERFEMRELQLALGLCINGCNKPVANGLNVWGEPWKTCGQDCCALKSAPESDKEGFPEPPTANTSVTSTPSKHIVQPSFLSPVEAFVEAPPDPLPSKQADDDDKEVERLAEARRSSFKQGSFWQCMFCEG